MMAMHCMHVAWEVVWLIAAKNGASCNIIKKLL